MKTRNSPRHSGPLRQCAAHHRQLSGLLVLFLAALRAVDTFGLVGAVEPGSGKSLHAGPGSGGGGAAASAPSTSARQLRQAAEGLDPSLIEPGRMVVLYTQFGDIRIRLLEKLAPQVTALVWDLASRRGCGEARCAFYRNEARPESGLGPPYALLQGRMHDLKEDPPYEGIIEVKRGHVCFIPGGKDWFISLGDHPEWGKSHPVWGVVDDFTVADIIIQQQYNNWTHPDHGTVLRILKIEVPIKMAVEGDTTFVGPVS